MRARHLHKLDPNYFTSLLLNYCPGSPLCLTPWLSALAVLLGCAHFSLAVPMLCAGPP